MNCEHATWVEVDLEAIRNNVAYFRQNSPAQVMAVVKANAYGHGAVRVARAALEAGATWCGVGRASEAFELRQAGIGSPILLMSLAPGEPLADLIAQDVSLPVWNAHQIEAAATAASAAGRRARLHLKVDTGMGRLGAPPSEALDLARGVGEAPDLALEGVFTHFARADESDALPNDRQSQMFRQVVQALDGAGLRPTVVHTANSAVALTRPADHYDLLRVGIAMYGLHPSSQCRLPEALRPALAWKTQLSMVKRLDGGQGVSYGHEYVTQEAERIGTLSVGYADGFRRHGDNQAIVKGRRAPVVGRVCMDLCMLQLDGVPGAEAGEEAVLIGSQGDETISAEDVARRWGTINYEVTCGIAARVPRIYV